MGDVQDHVAPLAKALRSGKPLAPTERMAIGLWLGALAVEIERLQARMSAIERGVLSLEQLSEVEAWVKQLRLDYELQQMGFDPGTPAPPQWLRDSGEAAPGMI